jgi:hypothetical protein
MLEAMIRCQGSMASNLPVQVTLGKMKDESRNQLLVDSSTELAEVLLSPSL